MSKRTWRRWAPAGVAAAMIAVGAVGVSLPAGASAELPAKSAEQVLALVGNAHVETLSGALVQESTLGLPQLPGGGGSASSGVASALELLTGSHTARVYSGGPTRSRVQVLDDLAERDVVRNGADVWVYSFGADAATHLTLPSGAAAGDSGDDPWVTGDVPTPELLAQHFLVAADPSTEVTVGPGTVVAGRSAYDLLLTPRTEQTLIEAVSIAVDSETGLPLSVRVQARGQEKPAFELAFTSISFAAPDAALFEFTPPPSATVREQALPPMGEPGHGDSGHGESAHGEPAHGDLGLTVSGSGWDSVLEVPVADLPVELTGSPLFAQLTRATGGGRVFHTAVVNVLLTDDGRVFAGSVPVARLQAAAAGS